MDVDRSISTNTSCMADGSVIASNMFCQNIFGIFAIQRTSSLFTR